MATRSAPAIEPDTITGSAEYVRWSLPHSDAVYQRYPITNPSCGISGGT